MGRADGISWEELDALEDFRSSPLFSAREKAALEYAEAVTGGNRVDEQLFAAVREAFAEDEIVELTAVVVWEIAAAKFNRALEIEGQGVCPLR